MEFLPLRLRFEIENGIIKSGSFEIVKYNASNIFAKLYDDIHVLDSFVK